MPVSVTAACFPAYTGFAIRIHYNRGRAELESDAAEQAIKDFTKAIELERNESGYYCARGEAFGKMGELDTALLDFNKAIRLNAKEPLAYYKRGHTYSLLKRWQLAIDDFSEALRLSPTNALAYHGRGLSFFKLGNTGRGTNELHQAIAYAPQSPEAYNSLAWLRATASSPSDRNGPQAVELAVKACEITGWKLWYCIGTLAAAYAESGDFETAVKYQKQSMQLNGATAQERLEQESRLELFERKLAFHETGSVK